MNPNSSQKDLISQLQVDVGIMKEQMTEVRDTQKTMLRTMQDFAFVKQSVFDVFVAEVRREYVTKDSIKGWKAFGQGVIVLVVAAVIVATLKVAAGGL